MTIVIPDSDFQLAARLIADRRRSHGDVVNEADIEKVVRSYVELGKTKKIIDWKATLPESEKDKIVVAVQRQTQSAHGFTPVYAKTWVNLDILEFLGSEGAVNQLIAQPRYWQEQLDRQLQVSRVDTAQKHPGGLFDFSYFTSGFKNIFGNITTPLLIGAAVVAGVILLRR